MFQSTHPHGVRPFTFLKTITLSMFQSTHPHGVRLLYDAATKRSDRFQSTHPHGVRPEVIDNIFCECDVSIHAPTRGATEMYAQRMGMSKVSIHAPTRGATWFDSSHLRQIKVSIHAPTRGATMLQVVFDLLDKFQSTHPHGVRHAKSRKSLTDIWFQSTHPHGVRQPANVLTFRKKKFQSTHPHGVRPEDCDELKGYIEVSIHAPTRGATVCKAKLVYCNLRFNPRTHTGCDNFQTLKFMDITVSIHAPTRGATQSEAQMY